MKKFNESDYIYKAKIGDKLYLQGNSQDGWDTTSDPDEAAIFESKTEPTQIINQMKKDGKIHKNDKITVLSESISDFKGHLLFGTAVLGIGALSAIDHNKVKLTADKLGIELAETEYGSHKAAGLVCPIYEYKYGMKGPMNIDSLCEYLKNHTDFDEITYEDEGDNYVINYTDNYAIHQTAANATVTKHRTSKGNLNLPKSYFDVSFVLDESKTTLFDNLFENVLNESNVTIAVWRRETAERLIEEANKIDPSYSFVEYDIGPKKEIKYKIFKNDNEYVGTFDVFTDEPYNSPYRYFFHHVNVGGLEFQGMTIDEFNKDFNEFIELDERVGHKALNEARVFSHSSGFGLSGHYNDYEMPRKEPLYIATETNEDDGELYFDERGCTTEFKTDAKKFTSEEEALEFAKNNVIFGEPGAKLYEKSEENTIYKEENTMKKLNEEAFERNIRYVIKGIFECNGKEKIFYYNKSLNNWSKYLVNPDPTQLANATLFKNVPKDETLEAASDAANNRKRCAVRFEDPEYELVEIIILELLKGRYGFSRVSQRSWPDGKRESLSDSVIQKEENTMKKLFENDDNGLFDYVLNESSSLKENECSLEWLLDKAYVSEYRMVGKNSAEVRVRHTPELLTSDSMTARFAEDIPDGYRLEVDFLGEDPILGRNFDIYEVQLLKD